MSLQAWPCLRTRTHRLPPQALPLSQVPDGETRLPDHHRGRQEVDQFLLLLGEISTGMRAGSSFPSIDFPEPVTFTSHQLRGYRGWVAARVYRAPTNHVRKECGSGRTSPSASRQAAMHRTAVARYRAAQRACRGRARSTDVAGRGTHPASQVRADATTGAQRSHSRGSNRQRSQHSAADSASRRRVGFVPQQCELNPTLSTTVREFVLLGTVGTPQRRQERQAHLQWALTRLVWKAWHGVTTGRSPVGSSSVPW